MFIPLNSNSELCDCVIYTDIIKIMLNVTMKIVTSPIKYAKGVMRIS